MAQTASLQELLERSLELDTLEGHLRQVRSDASGRLGLIGGEAGVGKTSVVRELQRQQRATPTL